MSERTTSDPHWRAGNGPLGRLLRPGRSIALRQARLAVFISIVIGVLLSVQEILVDLRRESIRADATFAQILAASKTSAVQAAYGLDTELAKRVLQGLFEYREIHQAEMIDNFGTVMATVERPRQDGPLKWLADAAFGATRHYERTLLRPGFSTPVGQLRFRVDTYLLAENFLERSGLVIGLGVLRTLLIAAALGVVFHFTLTRPLQAVAAAIRGGSAQVPVPRGHGSDELEELIGAHNQLIAERAASEQALRESEEKLRQAASMARLGYWIWDEVEDRCLYCSPECAEIHGMTPEQYVERMQNTKADANRAHPEDRARLHRVLSRAQAGRRSWDVEYRVLRPDGSERDVRELGQPVLDPQGNLIRSIGTIQDISDRKHSERMLLQAKMEAETANRTKSEFLANMSHELRTPLNSILGFTQIMHDQMFGPLGNARYVEYSDNILRSGHHLLEIISDILDISKIEAGEVVLDEEDLALRPLIEATCGMLSEREPRHGAPISLDIADDLPLLRADARLLRQILLNLLSNALKFTPTDGSITIGVRFDNDGLSLDVRDTGCGIAPEDLHKVLEPFGQSRSNALLSHEGVGLGLFLSSRFMALHQGTLDIESEPDRGTCVSLNFPADRMIGSQAREEEQA